MKNLNALILTLICSFMLSGPLQAQVLPDTTTASTTLPTTIDIEGGKHHLCGHCDANEELFEGNVYLTHATGNNFPPIVLELVVKDIYGNAITQYHSLLRTDFVRLSGTYGSNKEPAFKAQKDMIVDLSSLCVPGNGLVDGTATARLVESDGQGGYIDFPICNYNDQGELFSCHVFTAIPCDGETPSCVSTDHNIASTDFLFTCVAAQRSSDQETTLDTELTVRPNPFKESFWLDISADMLVQDIQLLDLKGQRIRTWDNIDLESATSIRLDTKDVEAGMYILQVHTKNKVLNIKVLRF